jgi:hypothetical protein
VEETVTISRSTFDRMNRALITIEKFLQEKEELKVEWLTEEQALSLLGCGRVKLYELKTLGKIKYKAVGRRHQYSRKSIESYNELMSSKTTKISANDHDFKQRRAASIDRPRSASPAQKRI